MGEIDRIKESQTGQPVPYHSRGGQACKTCADINDELREHDVPEARDQVLESGDEIIFAVSRRAREHPDGESEYEPMTRVHHCRHHGEYGQEFELAPGTQNYHEALVTAVVERTGFDFGEQKADLPGMEYEPDVAADALTFAQVDVMVYSGPRWGDEESEEVTTKMPNESDYATPLKLNSTWSSELQKAVYQYIQKHQ